MPSGSFQQAQYPQEIETASSVRKGAAKPVASATHCPYCALQCGMNLTLQSGLVSISERNFPANKGGLCIKGWTAAELLTHPDRLTLPLVRQPESREFQPVSWDIALDFIAHRLTEIQQKHGRDSIGVFGGGGLTNEKAYLLGKFARVALRTSQIDYNGRFCMASAATAAIQAFGIDRGLPFPLDDIPHAQTILLVGSNVAETMPPVMQYFDAQRRNGGSLIVADPRLTPTAAAATLHLQLTPGTDAALANGLLHIAVKEGWIAREFIESRTTGFDRVKRAVASYWPDRAERITGVPARQLAHAARLLGEAHSAMILTARGPEQQSRGVDNVLSFINLALALGQPGQPNSGWGCITGQGNGQGGREHGQKSDQLPGYRSITNAQHRAHIARVWNIEEAGLPGPGRSAYEMLDGIGQPGGLHALLVFASNLAVSAPRASHIQKRLEALDLLVVSDIFLSETAQLAHVVLPTTQWAEEDGTMTNLEGRVILRRRAVQPPPQVRSDLEIFNGLAARLHCASAFPTEPRDAFEELRSASAGGAADYSGITYQRIEDEDGVFWPCPDVAHPGTPRLFQERFATGDGRARFHPIEYRGPAEVPDYEFPLFLTTGREMAHYQSGAQTRRVKPLAHASPKSFVQINPAMARNYGIAEGDKVSLTTRRGAAIAIARLTSTIRMDTLFVPFHFPGEERANILTNPALDPASKMPEFKVCAARIQKHVRESEIPSRSLSIHR